MKPVILPVPHIQQRKPGECLAACAAMALGYIGISVAYDRLLKLLNVRDFGTTSSQIRNLEKLGVVVIYKTGTLDELYEHLTNDRPCIAFVKTHQLPYWTEETDHAVVVAGLDDKMVYLNDPDFLDAPIQVARGDFDLAWLEWEELYAALMRRS